MKQPNWKIFLLSTFLVFGFNFRILTQEAFGQSIIGAEMYKHWFGYDVNVHLDVYTTGPESPPDNYIFLDWGDGIVDSVKLFHSYYTTSSVRREVYYAEHCYDTAGYYAITYADSFLVENVFNIENSGTKSFQLIDSIRLFPDGHPYFSNDTGIEYVSTQPVSRSFKPGYMTIGNSLEFDSYLLNITSSELAPFPVEGFTFPDDPDKIYLDELYCVIWEYPIEPGLYALAVKTKELEEDLDSPGDTITIATTTRPMIFVVIDNLVSTFEQTDSAFFTVAPNPASTEMYVSASGLLQGEKFDIRVRNINGVIVYSETFDSRSFGEVVIPISDWANGMYIVEVIDEGKSYFKTLMKLE